MRPQDIVILLKILSYNGKKWLHKDLARDLYISPAEISQALQRCVISGILNEQKTRVRKEALLELLIYGVPYVFPALTGRKSKGVATAHSHPFFADKIISTESYVWPDAKSNERGTSLKPLYSESVQAAKLDKKLYLLLALVDVLRIGKVREKKIAIETLKQIFDESPN